MKLKISLDKIIKIKKACIDYEDQLETNVYLAHKNKKCALMIEQKQLDLADTYKSILKSINASRMDESVEATVVLEPHETMVLYEAVSYKLYSTLVSANEYGCWLEIQEYLRTEFEV